MFGRTDRVDVSKLEFEREKQQYTCLCIHIFPTDTISYDDAYGILCRIYETDLSGSLCAALGHTLHLHINLHSVA